MAVKLRLMRIGKKKQPVYRVVAADARSPRDGRFIEILGTYEPRAEPLDDPQALWVHDLIGSQLIDTGGVDRGVVTDVQANPASDLLVLEGGGLVPLCFVVDHRPGRVTADLPAGLLED